MSTNVPLDAASTSDEPLTNLLFDYPGADIILRTQDSYHFQVPKIHIVKGSPVLGELMRKAVDSPRAPIDDEPTLPVIQLPESGKILHSLLTFILPVTPLIPSTPEEAMKLLSVAQKYQMETALTHIRGTIARSYPLPTRLESALRIYALAQTYGLLPEALQTARTILKFPITVEDLVDIMPGAYLYELWKYHENVRAILWSNLIGFRMSCAQDTIKGLRCTYFSRFHSPSWLDEYIESIGKTPHLFDPAEFDITMARHIKDKANESGCGCASIPCHTVRQFWKALSNVVRVSFEKAESALSLVRDQESAQAQTNSAISPLGPIEVPYADLVIRSSDLVDFRVHKPVLAMASPIFTDLFSLPQPSDSESVNGLPVVQLSENSELLNSLISVLYPIPTVMPNSYENVLYLLAACQKYEMDSVQSSIRAEVSHRAFPTLKGAEAFAAYAIASAKDLIPEMENAARLTLDHPMTFKSLGGGLRLIEGWAMNDLVDFRKRCRDNLIACLGSFLEVQPSGPSSIWVGCPEVMPMGFQQEKVRQLPRWLNELLSRNQNVLKLQTFTHPLDIRSRIRQEYVTALQKHATCNFCPGVHLRNGLTFCAELENKLVEARDKVRNDRGSHLDLT